MQPSPTAPSPALTGWVAVGVLVAAYALSFVDRQIVSLLVEPIKGDLGLTDTQIGLLQGPAFGLFYSILGLPLGFMADRVHRIRLIAAGIALWSLMTVLCGLAADFNSLFLARVGVGVGEAALVPAAVSLLADLFRPEKRAFPMSVFTAGLSVGAGLALILGGSFIAYAGAGAAGLPVIGAWLGQHAPWQVVFILAGLSGLPVVIAILCVKEPVRQDAAPPEAEGVLGGFRYLKAHWRLFAPLLAGTSLLYLYTNAKAAWLPSLFIRGFGWTPAEVGLQLGLWIMAAAVTGNLASGLLATRLARTRPAAPLLTMLIGCAMMAPFALLGPLAPTPTLAMAGVVGAYLSIALCFGVATATFVAITPGRLRGQVVALYLLLGNLIGMSLGPTSIGALLDHVLRSPDEVGPAIAIVAAATVVPGWLLMRWALSRYRAQATVIAA
jgi:MFS family permease